jgi:hypothetical protein
MPSFFSFSQSLTWCRRLGREPVSDRLEVPFLLGALDGVAERLADICERLAAGVDPQGRAAGQAEVADHE